MEEELHKVKILIRDTYISASKPDVLIFTGMTKEEIKKIKQEMNFEQCAEVGGDLLDIKLVSIDDKII